MSMNSRLPAPAYGYGRQKTESRRIEGPGRSEYIITHRHGSEYQKQSVFASGQPQSLPSRYKNHGPEQEAYFHAPPPRPQIQHGYDPMLHMSPASPGEDAQFYTIQPGDHGHPPGFDRHGHHGHPPQIAHQSSSDYSSIGLDSDFESVERFRAGQSRRYRLSTSQIKRPPNVCISPQHGQLERHF